MARWTTRNEPDASCDSHSLEKQSPLQDVYVTGIETLSSLLRDTEDLSTVAEPTIFSTSWALGGILILILSSWGHRNNYLSALVSFKSVAMHCCRQWHWAVLPGLPWLQAENNVAKDADNLESRAKFSSNLTPKLKKEPRSRSGCMQLLGLLAHLPTEVTRGEKISDRQKSPMHSLASTSHKPRFAYTLP